MDLDPNWNPQFKDAKVIAAMKRATGLDFNRALLPASTDDRIRKIWDLIEAASERLKQWLTRVLPEYETARNGIRALEAKVRQAKTKQERDAASVELKTARDAYEKNADLAALRALFEAFTEPTVRSWAIYGIQTIPPELVDAFKDAGKRYGARWGGEYDTSKDGMHLELLAPMVIKRSSPLPRTLDELANGVPPPPPPECDADG